jgi:hypothetical protein
MVLDRLCTEIFEPSSRQAEEQRKFNRNKELFRGEERGKEHRKQNMIPDMDVMQFSPPQRNLVFQALDEAEKRTSGYYCIPPFRWERLQYDLLTQADHGWEPLPEPTLARVRCLQRVNRNRAFDFYRIELNDRSILEAAHRENLTTDLYPFFVYILTHEMVHMVRLSSILDGPDTLVPCEETEEKRVQRISRGILESSLNFRPVLDKFCS